MCKTYIEVADRVGMIGVMKTRFLRYMKARWIDSEEVECQTGYAEEWAMRFLGKYEYSASDMIGQSILKKIDNAMRIERVDI